MVARNELSEEVQHGRAEACSTRPGRRRSTKALGQAGVGHVGGQKDDLTAVREGRGGRACVQKVQFGP